MNVLALRVARVDGAHERLQARPQLIDALDEDDMIRRAAAPVQELVLGGRQLGSLEVLLGVAADLRARNDDRVRGLEGADLRPERIRVAETELAVSELEQDELAGDNIRHFAAWIGPAPGVTISPSSGPFVKSAFDVLRSTERVTDGGDITVKGYKDGIVYLIRKGACSGCPSSTATLKHGIENLFKHFLPEVKGVEQM